MREYRYDFLKGLAILAVVAIHCIGQFAAVSPNPAAWRFADLMLRPAVPIFLFVSGCLYARPANWAYLKQRLSRVLLPYSLAFCASILVIYQFNLGELLSDLIKLPAFFLFGKGFGHYFIFILICSYALLFLAGKLKFLSGEKLKWLLGAALLLHLASMLTSNYIYTKLELANYSFSGEDLQSFFSYRNPLTWLIFVLAGYAYRQRGKLQFLTAKPWLSRLCLVFTISLYVVAYQSKTINYQAYNSLLWSALSFSAISVLLTLPLNHSTKLQKLFEKLSQGSFTIYLLHFFVIYFYATIAKLLLPDQIEWLGIIPTYALAVVVPLRVQQFIDTYRRIAR
jgi:surface polysaccharide O-acyltransferase-like enzyme